MVAQLRVEVSGPVATVVIDNPGRRNSLTVQMWQRVPALFAELAADNAVLVVVLRGANGDFSAGADIRDLERIFLDEPATGGDAGGLITAAEEAIASFPKPTIAAIEGNCIGGGWELAAACDIRFAADSATFGVTPARIGIIYPLSGIRRLVDIAGPAAARYLLYSGDFVDAAAALQLGLLSRVVAQSALDAEVAALATRLAGHSQLSIQATKELIDTIVSGDEDALAQAAAAWRAELAASDEPRIGREAFLAREQPLFTWRGRAIE